MSAVINMETTKTMRSSSVDHPTNREEAEAPMMDAMITTIRFLCSSCCLQSYAVACYVKHDQGVPPEVLNFRPERAGN